MRRVKGKARLSWAPLRRGGDAILAKGKDATNARRVGTRRVVGQPRRGQGADTLVVTLRGYRLDAKNEGLIGECWTRKRLRMAVQDREGGRAVMPRDRVTGVFEQRRLRREVFRRGRGAG
jgi:hypothetical protein